MMNKKLWNINMWQGSILNIIINTIVKKTMFKANNLFTLSSGITLKCLKRTVQLSLSLSHFTLHSFWICNTMRFSPFTQESNGYECFVGNNFDLKMRCKLYLKKSIQWLEEALYAETIIVTALDPPSPLFLFSTS